LLAIPAIADQMRIAIQL